MEIGAWTEFPEGEAIGEREIGGMNSAIFIT